MNCEKCGAEIPEGSTTCEACSEEKPVFTFRLKEDEPKPKVNENQNVQSSGYGQSPVAPGQPTGMPYQPVQPQQRPAVSSGGFDWKEVNVASIIAAGLLLLALVTPYAKAFGIEVTLMDGDRGKVYLLLSLVAIVFSVLDKPIIVIVCGAIACVYAFCDIVDFSGCSMGFLKKGMGYYLMILGSLGILLTGVVRSQK